MINHDTCNEALFPGGALEGYSESPMRVAGFPPTKTFTNDLDQRTFPKTLEIFTDTSNYFLAVKKRANLWSERNPISSIKKDGDFLWSMLV